MITAWIGSITLLMIAVLYITLVAGLPYGDFAMGGKYKVIPKQMRIACAVSVLVQIVAILVVLQTGKVISIGLPQGIAKGVSYFFAAYLALNTVMNLLSKSKREKLVMTPLSLLTAICFGLTALHG